MTRQLAFLSLVLLFGCTKLQDDFEFPSNEVTSSSLSVEGAQGGTLLLGTEYKVSVSVVCKYKTRNTKLFVQSEVKGVVKDGSKNALDVNVGVGVSEAMTFYFTPSQSGEGQTLSLDVKQGDVLVKTLTYTYNVGVAKFKVVDNSEVKTRPMLRNSRDTLNYLVVNLSTTPQNVKLALKQMSGTSIKLVDTTNAVGRVTDGSGKARMATDGRSIVVEGTTHKPNAEELAILRKLGYLGSSCATCRTEGTIADELNVLQVKVPIYSSLTAGVSKIDASATGDRGGTDAVSTDVNVTEESYVFDEVAAVNAEPYVLSENNPLTYKFSTNDALTQNGSSFSVKVHTAATNIVFKYYEGATLKTLANDEVLPLNTKITRDANGLPLINKWDAELGVKSASTGVMPLKASMTSSLYYTFTGEGSASVTLSLISETGGKEATQTITLTPKATTPDWGGMQFTKKLGLSDVGIQSGSVPNQFNINITDKNQYAKYDVKIEKNFLNGSSGAWAFTNSGIKLNTATYTYLNWSINNNVKDVSLITNTSVSELNKLIGKYEVVTTFKRNYKDASNKDEYERRDTLEIWDDRLDVHFTLYEKETSALSSNLSMSAMSTDTTLYSFNIASESYKAAYNNYTIKIECEGDATDIALSTFKANTYVNNAIQTNQALTLGTEYAIGGNGDAKMHIKVNPTKFSLDRQDRTISKVKVTIKDTRTNATKTYDLGSLSTSYKKSSLANLGSQTSAVNASGVGMVSSLSFGSGVQNNGYRFSIYFDSKLAQSSVDMSSAFSGGTYTFGSAYAAAANGGVNQATTSAVRANTTFENIENETFSQSSSGTCYATGSWGTTTSTWSSGTEYRDVVVYYQTSNYYVKRSAVEVKDNFGNSVFSGSLDYIGSTLQNTTNVVNSAYKISTTRQSRTKTGSCTSGSASTASTASASYGSWH